MDQEVLESEGYWANDDWWVNGKRHREDGPAIEWSDGTKAWFLNGKRHREDGPAEEWADGYKSWWVNEKRHRLDGPAIEWSNGTKFWFLNNKEISEDLHCKLTQGSIKDLPLYLGLGCDEYISERLKNES